MEKEFKELLKQSKRSLEDAEEKIEAFSKDFPEDATEFWIELKKRFADISSKLQKSYNSAEGETELQLNLGMMEAREKLEQIKYSVEKLLLQASKSTEEEYDIAALKAHLAKMEGEDLWEEKQKELSQLYGSSKTEVEKLAKRAGKEFNDIFLKLTDMV